MPTRGAELVVHIITDASKAAQGVDEAISGYSKFENAIQSLAGPAALVLGGIVSLGALSFNAVAKQSTEAAKAQDELKESFVEMGIAIGTALLPVILPLVEALTKMARWVSENIDWISKLVAIVGILAAGILALNAAMAIAKIASAAWATITGIVTTAQLGLNAAMLANPIGLVVAAIVALIAVFVILWNNCEAFRDFWITMWNAIKEVVTTVVNALRPILEPLIDLIQRVLAGAFDVVIDRINRLFEVAMRVLNALLPPIMRIVSAFEKVAAVVQRVLNLISRIKIPNLSGLKPFANSAAVLTVAPTQVVYGATSPAGARSAVPPVSRGAASGGTVINITVNGALDPQSVSKQIARMLRVREGRVGLSSAAGLRA